MIRSMVCMVCLLDEIASIERVCFVRFEKCSITEHGVTQISYVRETIIAIGNLRNLPRELFRVCVEDRTEVK